MNIVVQQTREPDAYRAVRSWRQQGQGDGGAGDVAIPAPPEPLRITLEGTAGTGKAAFIRKNGV